MSSRNDLRRERVCIREPRSAVKKGRKKRHIIQKSRSTRSKGLISCHYYRRCFIEDRSMDNELLAFKQGIRSSGILWFILGHGIRMVDIELCWFGNATRWALSRFWKHI
ncbi:hypothetical protein BJX65DRAFT_127041 [Aspergillus insuetus]